ncbi:MAG: hypothetical protein M3518_04750 [Actinomycetota bacterium]|nr:hypothetical protein [Actinomycetota bacterium]
MIREALIGAAAGAVGTVALNATTYADMALRGRAASSVPSEIAAALAEKAGVDLSAEDEGPEDETAQNRKSGLGALSGYVVGLGVGTAYGLVRPHLGDVSIPLAGLGLALVAMAGADVPAATLGVTAPATWPVSTWMMDFGFHLPYGLVTAVAYEAFNGTS